MSTLTLLRLDVRSGDGNNTLTGLGSRIVRGGVDLLGYDYEAIRG